jgi:epoxyqueuosine reductase QueG
MTTEKADINEASAKVQEALADLNVDLVGVAGMEALKDTKLEEQIKKLLPETNSVIVLGMEIYEETLRLTSPERLLGAASTNDIMESQVEYLNGKLAEAANDIARVSHKARLKAMPVPADSYPYDARFSNADISFIDAAEAAGLGQPGYNTLILTGKYGPRVRFSVCLSEAILEPTTDKSAKYCRECNVCIAKCPAKALDYPDRGEPYKFNKYACSTFLNESGDCWECVKHCPVATKMYD